MKPKAVRTCFCPAGTLNRVLSCLFILCVGCLLKHSTHLEFLEQVCLFSSSYSFLSANRFSLGCSCINLQVNNR